MATSFSPNKNPYADDLLRLSNAPKSRFTAQERHLSASVLASKLYGLELASLRNYWWPEHNHLFVQAGGQLVLVEVLFESEISELHLLELQYRVYSVDLWDAHVIVLKVGVSGVIELYNGKWDAKRLMDSIGAHLQHSDAPAFTDGPGLDSIPPISDEEASTAYFGTTDVNGGGVNGDGRQQGGGGGGFRGGDGDNGGQAPGSGGVLELLNHPVLFTVDEEALNAILEANE